MTAIARHNYNPLRYTTNWFDFDALDFDKFFAPKSYNIETSDSGLTLSVDLPGVKASDLSLQIEGHVLKISGKQRGNDIRQTYQLSKQYDPESATAKLEDGVLTVGFLKREEAKPKTINIQIK
jgi:HSP20 family protein